MTGAGTLLRKNGEVTCFISRAITTINDPSLIYPFGFRSLVMLDMTKSFDFTKMSPFRADVGKDLFPGFHLSKIPSGPLGFSMFIHWVLEFGPLFLKCCFALIDLHCFLN